MTLRPNESNLGGKGSQENSESQLSSLIDVFAKRHNNLNRKYEDLETAAERMNLIH